MKRGMRVALALASVLAAVVALAACGSSGSSSGGGNDSGEVVEISFWHGQSEETAEALEELVDEFNETHPTIKVSKDAGGVQADEMLTKVTAALASGSYPDIAYIFGSDVANVARSPKAVDLTEAVQEPGWNWDDFWPSERATATIDGHVRAIPALADVLALIYNKKLFEEAGVEPPNENTSWDEYRQLTKEVTDPGKGIFGSAWPGVGGEDTVWRLWPMVWQLGGEIVSDDGKSVGFDNESGLQSLTTIHDMAVVDKSVYVDPDPSGDRTGQLFQNGKLAVWPAGPWALLDVKTGGIEAGVAPLPAYRGEHTSIAGPDNWMVFDNGDARREAAITFLKWLSAPKQDLRWAEATGQLPLRSTTAEMPAFERYAEEWPGIDTFVESLAGGRSRPNLETYPQMSEAVGRGLVSVLLGEAEPADALKKMSQEANEALAGN